MLFICFLVKSLSSTGMTIDFHKNPKVIKEEILEPVRKFSTSGTICIPSEFEVFPWEPVDSLEFYGVFLPKETFEFSFNKDKISIKKSIDTLSSKLQLALELSPSWLKLPLEYRFRKLKEDAHLYADMIINAEPKLRDEIAFQIAYMGEEILTDTLFDPGSIVRNAELLYEIDDSIQYTDIVDYKDYSTIKYRVLNGNDTVECEAPFYIYYFYVVHPIISDEFPRTDEYVYNKLWREYLLFEADEGYPKLIDVIKNAKILWKRKKEVLPAGRPFLPTNSALDIISNWVTYTVPEMARGNRPIHPNVIAHEHNGNCGELQDILAAAGRACLVPVVCLLDPCEDHVWNEFWDQGWYPYQVDRGFGASHIADSTISYDKDRGGGKNVSCVWRWRSDGLWETVTRTYSDVCSLYVEVKDKRGMPVDGARVLLYSDYIYGGISLTAGSFTDRDGKTAFEIGDMCNFYMQVISPIGRYPKEENTVVKIIETSLPGAVYCKEISIDSVVQILKPELSIPKDTIERFKIVFKKDSLKTLNYGYCITRYAGWPDPGYEIRFYQSFIDEEKNGDFAFYLMGKDGYSSYKNNERFSVDYLNLKQAEDFEIIPFSGYSTYYSVISNAHRTSISEMISGKFIIYWNPAVGISEERKRYEMFVLTPCRGRVLMKFNGAFEKEIEILDCLGRRVRSFKGNEEKIVWDGKDERGVRVNSGVYFLKLKTKSYEDIRKIVFLR